jgi:serine/threonine protein kinase
VAERQFGPYKLVRQIAVGGMAEIHLAKTAGIAGFEKYVALKMIHPNFAEDDQFIQMLVDEAKIAVQLTHGNIAQTFDLGRVGETYYITMEYVDGADLYKILRRASEQDLEMPLDVCAFVGKEISSALDHAHRKRDHTGRSLGIVHRDVSPQNVLVSYSGEVKLVDFGIAKATMKARQTAVGVIKGKYYYMSPEQAWGDPIDHRSDIFSAGIVLYEMITGQMLYLEEDLHKLLEMARNANIAPPSKLRRGVPPQLERIVMHALAKVPGERYQSAGDFATDLERFLHAYSPVFTTSKLATLMRQVVGDPMQVPDDAPFENIEFRDGVMSTHPLDDSEVAHAIDRDELRDENSMIFRVSDLEKAEAEAASTASMPAAVSPARALPRPGTPPPLPRPGTPPPLPRPGTPPPTPSVARPTPSSARPTAPSKPLKQTAPRETRATDSMAAAPRPAPAGKIPSIAPGAAARQASPAKPPSLGKPRQADEDTRQLEHAAPANPLHDDSSGLLLPDGRKLTGDEADRGDMLDDDLENIGERTLVTPASGMAGMSGFMMDLGGNDDDGPVEATLITAMPTAAGFGAEADPAADRQDDDGPTVTREIPTDKPTKPANPRLKASPPPALAAKIHAPAVSELRKPRASRRTPSGGTPIPQQNVLQAIVSSRASEPMPAPRPTPVSQAALAPPMPDPLARTAPQVAIPHGPHTPTDPFASQFPAGTPGGQAPYHHDASGLPLGAPTPPGMSAQQQVPGVPDHLQPYLHMQGMQPGHGSPQMSPHGYPQISPGALYQFQPSPQQIQGMSITGQMRLYEADELPSQYKLGAARRRWFTYIASGVLAVSVAAAVTFLIIRSTRESVPAVGSVHIVSVPAGAEVLFDGTRLTDKTPLMLDGAPVGTRHAVRLELPRHESYEETVDIPRTGGEVSVTATLKPITGKVIVDSEPSNAEIRINGELRGRTPTTINDVDMDNAKRIELRLKDYQPFQQDLQWPSDGKVRIKATLVHVR